jgi:hypothetical protein
MGWDELVAPLNVILTHFDILPHFDIPPDIPPPPRHILFPY